MDTTRDYVYFEPLFYEEDFENFKSDICHFLKTLGDRDFLFTAISEKWVPVFFAAEMYKKGFYTLALTDYLSEIHGLNPFPGYKPFRCLKLPIMVFPEILL